MKITVERFISDPDSTLSLVSIDDHFVCFGLEDEYREDKIVGQTRIPAGRYQIKVREFGGFYGRYTRRFQPWHKGMMEIAGVPGFTDILIHCGNTDDHTSGCLLVGRGAVSRPRQMMVTYSADAYEFLYKLAYPSAEAGDLEIGFLDCDRKLP